MGEGLMGILQITSNFTPTFPHSHLIGCGHNLLNKQNGSQYPIVSFSAGKEYEYWSSHSRYFKFQGLNAGHKIWRETQIAKNKRKKYETFCFWEQIKESPKLSEAIEPYNLIPPKNHLFIENILRYWLITKIFFLE